MKRARIIASTIATTSGPRRARVRSIIGAAVMGAASAALTTGMTDVASVATGMTVVASESTGGPLTNMLLTAAAVGRSSGSIAVIDTMSAASGPLTVTGISGGR